MKLIIDLLKAQKTDKMSKTVKGASKSTKRKSSTSKASKPSTDSKKATSKGTRSAEIEAKYPGGHWVTMRGHHIYVTGKGAIAKETLPAGITHAEAKAHVAKKQATPKTKKPAAPAPIAGDARVGRKVRGGQAIDNGDGTHSFTFTGTHEGVRGTHTVNIPSAEFKPHATTSPETKPKRTRVPKTDAMKLGEKQAKDEKQAIKALEDRVKEQRKQNRESRKTDKQRALDAPTLVRDPVHDGSKPAKEVKQTIGRKADAEAKAAEAAKKHFESDPGQINRELEKKGKAPLDTKLEEQEVAGQFMPGHFPVRIGTDTDGKGIYHNKENPTLDEIVDSHQGLLMNAVSKKMANRYGLQALQREHAWFDKNGKPSDLFGDVHQEANLGFIKGVQEYLRDPAKFENVSPLAHAINRARDNVKRRMQRILNDVPLPEKFLTPLAAYGAAHAKVMSIHGDSQLKGAEKLKAIADQMKQDGTDKIIHGLGFKGADGTVVTDFHKKLELLDGVKRLQRANTRLDQTTDGGDSGDKEQSLHEKVGTAEDKDARIIAKERDDELGGALRKLMGDTLSDREMQVVAMKHGISLKKLAGGGEDAEFQEIAKKLNLGLSNAKKIYYTALKKLKSAPPERLKQLHDMLLNKSLVMDLMKTLYTQSLEDMMGELGLGMESLQTVYVGRTYANTLEEIEKSLDVHQFVGSYIRTEWGVVANVVEYELPDEDVLVKAMSDMLEKAQSDPHDAIRGWVNANASKFSSMSSTQHAAAKAKSGQLTWSEQLLLEHPGSAWVTWGGHKVLMKGNGSVAYSSGIQEHREKYHPGVDHPDYHHEQMEGHQDLAAEHARNQFEDLKGRWHGSDVHGKGLKHQLSTDVHNWGHYLKTANGVHFQKDVHGGMSEDELKDMFGADNVKSAKQNALKKMAPGHYELTNPETGKRVVVHLDWKETNRDKDGNPTDGKSAYALELKRAYDPDADVSKGDNKELQSNRGFLRYMGYNLEPEKGDKEGLAQQQYHFSLNDIKDALGATLRNQANTNYDKNKKGTQLLLRQMEADEFEKEHGKSTTVQRQNMAYKLENIKDVTPESVKTTKGESVPYHGKVFEVPLANGTTSRFEINAHGAFSDPLMQKLLDPSFPIHTANDLYTALAGAVGKEKYITLSNNEWAVGTGMHHHVKVRFDGQGAPVVVGGAFDGKRLQDAAEMASKEDKDQSLFKNGKLISGKMKMSKDEEIPFQEGGAIRYRDGKHWKEGKILKMYQDGFVRIRKENGDTETYQASSRNRIRPAKTGKQVVAGELPTVHYDGNDLKLHVGENDDVRNKINELGVELDDKGRANVSINQLEQIRDKVGGFSMTDAARDHMGDYFRKQESDRYPTDVSALWNKYDPSKIDGWKSESFLHKSDANPTANFSSAQAEGIDHLLNVKKGIAGHGMGTGKTVLGVGAAAYARDQRIKAGQDGGKTLVVSPAGIMSEWVKEIEGHTNLGHVVIGSKSNHGVPLAYKNDVTGENGLATNQVGYDKFNPADHKDKHFHIMSRDTFMGMRDDMGAEKFNKWLKDNGYNNAIFDEVHAFKTKGGARNDALKETSKHLENVWGLSGTPMDNNVPDIYHLVDAVTGGVHNLGSEKEFNANYIQRENGKITGINQANLSEMGRKVGQYAHFRHGRDVQMSVNGETKQLSFPEVKGGGNHYQGNVVHIMDHESHMVPVQGGAEGEMREVNVPKVANPSASGEVRTRNVQAKTADGKTVTVQHFEHGHDGDLNSHFMARYKRLESSVLSPNQRQALTDAEKSGESGAGSQSYLPAIQKLQQFTNAPLSQHAYFKRDENGGIKQYEFIHDDRGHRLYRAANEDGAAKVDEKGNPVYLPPMHHYNPKALALKDHVEGLLDNWKADMQQRSAFNEAHGLKPGDDNYKPLYPPKIAITSQYNDFGKEVIKNVLRDIKHDRGDLGVPLTTGEFSGDNLDTRAKDALEYNSKHTMNDPGHSFMVFTDAGKEGVDMGNSHDLIHYDHDFNAQESAQKSAREIRASSYKHADREKRANTVGLHTLAVPGTIEDSILRTQSKKMTNIAQVEGAVRQAESQGTKSDLMKYNAGSARNFGRNTQKLEKQRSRKSNKVAKSLKTAELEGRAVHVIYLK